MSALGSLVREVEEAIASGVPERRAHSLRQLTELFVEHASKLKDDHVSVFDEVIIRLAREVDSKARIELSARLADIDNAPVSVVKDLAYDDNVAVAEPVLERSIRLSEDDLLDLADSKEQGHLLAVSRRRTLSERVADVLVKRGNQNVVRTVAQNEGAKLSEGTLASLAQKALGDNSLRSLLLKRLDLHEERLRGLANPVLETKGAYEPKAKPEVTAEMRRMEAAIGNLAASMTGSGELTRDISLLVERLARNSKGKPVEEVRVANWIKTDKIDDVLAAITHNAGVPAAVVVRAYDAPTYEPLLLVMRAARLSWNTFKLLLTSRDGRVPAAEVVKTSFETFQQLSVAHAQQVARLVTRPEFETGTTAAA